MHTPSGTLRGIVMLCLASLCFTLNDTFTKFLVEDYHVSEIILIRSLIALPLLMGLAVVIGRTQVRWSSKVVFHAVRGLLNLVAAYLYINGLHYLSVAEATVILFSSPLIVTAAATVLFRERVGWQKWAAALVSFVGVVVAIRPGAEAFQPASLFILAASVLYAANSLTARYLPEADNLWTVSFFGAAFAALFVAPVAVTAWVPLQMEDLTLFTAAALCSSLGVGLASLAYRLALSSDLAPFAYSGLIWSIGTTFVVWGTMPTPSTFLGALVIAASSLFYFLAKGRRDTA